MARARRPLDAVDNPPSLTGQRGQAVTGALRAPVDKMLKRIGAAIRAMDLPAIEKISEEQSGTAFHVLIATMLSAQTRDPVTLDITSSRAG